MKAGDWVTDGKRTGVVVGGEVFWLGGDVSPVSDALTTVSREEAERALVASRPIGEEQET